MSIFKNQHSNSLIQKDDPWHKRAWKWARHQVFNTTAEVWVLAALGLTLAGGLSARYYASKAGEIPLAFSEIEQITSDFNKAGKPVPALTQYYAVNNDITMKVFESNNIALAVNKSHTVFAHEMQTRVDASLKKHALISEYADGMARDGANALESVRKLEDATRALPAVSNALDNSWDASHYDVTHQEPRTSRSCDSKGNCTTSTYYVTVYDYTIHTFTYHAQEAQRALTLLKDFVVNTPDLSVQERLYVAGMTHGENQEAIRNSMKAKFKDHAPTEAEYLEYANTWAKGSNLHKYAPQAAAEYRELASMINALEAAQETARSARYITYSHYDSGPKEHRIAEAAETHADRAIQASHGVTDGIHFSMQQAPELNRMIKEYVDVVLNGKQGDADELRSGIMKTARAMYDNNYENGFDVHTFKWLNV
ncbi:MAG TPA: hypothetical protein VEF76_00425, partial [Patescibacteria group bacterium]|nr:hypothetical protein [Patescibacteria group bacterium]